VVKEVKFSVTVDEHDYQTKKNQAVKFLAGGDKVKASLRFRGRQMAHRELGYAIVNRLIQDIGDAALWNSCRAWKEPFCMRFLPVKEAGSAQAQASNCATSRRRGGAGVTVCSFDCRKAARLSGLCFGCA